MACPVPTILRTLGAYRSGERATLAGRFDLDRQDDPRSIWEFAPETMVRLMEADYFLLKMAENYGEPFVFSSNLHAEIQALRNITLQMQKELCRADGFARWYEAKQAEMQSIPLLKSFYEARIEVVHRNTLRKASMMHKAVVKDGELHIVPSEGEHFSDPFMNTRVALQEIKQLVCALTGMAAASFEVGLKRERVVPEVSFREIVGECHVALDYFGRMVADLGTAFGFEFAWRPQDLQPLRRFQVAFSGPTDPSLADLWV